MSEGNPRVTTMLNNVGVTVPANWCAAAVSTWIKDAASKAGVQMPIKGSAGAKTVMTQFQDSTNNRVGWVNADALRYDPKLVAPGMIVVWQRGPTASWMGHIGIVSANLGNGKFKSIEGNAGNGAGAVVESTHELSPASLLGMGYFIDGAVYAQKAQGGNVAGVAGMLGALPTGVAPSFEKIRVGNTELFVEVANTESARAYGLMNRMSLPPNHGMLFEFPVAKNHAFYMKNTYIPLDIIFLDSHYRVIGFLFSMQPHSLELKSIGALSKYAIEVNAGYVRANDVHIGQVLMPDASAQAGLGYYADPPGIETFAPPGA